MKKAIFIIILLFVVVIGYILITSRENNRNAVSSFEECVLAGNPIAESYPRQCMDGDNLFVEEIENELNNENIGEINEIEPGINEEVENEESEEELEESVYAEREELLRSYLDENISELSPEKEVLGGKFFITSLVLTGINGFNIEYEDGHIACSASGIYYMDKNNNVNIQEFNFIEKN